MKMSLPALGVIGGAAIALALLAVASAGLLNTAGANYKVLVAVWLWTLPVTGTLAGVGYAVGRMVAAVTGANTAKTKRGSDADAG